MLELDVLPERPLLPTSARQARFELRVRAEAPRLPRRIVLVLDRSSSMAGPRFVYARRLAGPPLLRVAVLVLVLANPWAPQILALLGLFDNWLDFRKWAEPPSEGE